MYPRRSFTSFTEQGFPSEVLRLLFELSRSIPIALAPPGPGCFFVDENVVQPLAYHLPPNQLARLLPVVSRNLNDL